MKTTMFFSCLLLALSFSLGTLAQDNPKDMSLNREEITAIKAKLVAAVAAVGVHELYKKEREDFQLPTDWNEANEGKIRPYNASVNLRFVDKTKISTSDQNKMTEEHQQKINEAMAKGDYEAVQNLSLKMQEEIMKAAQVQSAPKLADISVDIQLNSSGYSAIDPDKIVFESPGVIALKERQNETSQEGNVTIYIDPVTLKDTKKLAKLNLPVDDIALEQKMRTFNIVIYLRGPYELAQSWAKKVNSKALLGLIGK